MGKRVLFAEEIFQNKLFETENIFKLFLSFKMASLKILCATKVCEKSGIVELDDYVKELSEFIRKGEDGIFDSMKVNYADFVRILFGWKHFTENSCSFFLDKEENLCGKMTEYSGKSVLREAWYINGKKEGLEITRYTNGEKFTETHWVNDKKNGVETEWHRDGTLAFQTDFKDDLRHGKFVIYGVSPEQANKVVLTMKYENDKFVK
ncbi:hypothetical protein ISTM_299 [Insectomime virus]|nr:hypothetical protein ISTM_299 [Insectomime virus]